MHPDIYRQMWYLICGFYFVRRTVHCIPKSLIRSPSFPVLLPAAAALLNEGRQASSSFFGQCDIARVALL